MVQVGILRHAKSSWNEPGLDDFDRPLNDRGRTAAPIMGQVLASLNFAPDIILCSPSKRTRETLALIEPSIVRAPKLIDFDERLYLAPASELMAILRKIDTPATAVLLIGHNPGLHNLLTQFTATGSSGDVARAGEKLPTAAFALISFPGNTFHDIAPRTGHLETFITPKDRA